jgi:hypothetical protein
MLPRIDIQIIAYFMKEIEETGKGEINFKEEATRRKRI